MINTISRILLTSSVIALTACGGGGGDDTTTDTTSPPPPASITLKTATSGSVDLSTTELSGSITTACYANNSNGRIDSVSISDLTWTYNEYTYSGDTSCSTTPITQTVVATLSIGADSTIDVNNNGWIDGNNTPLTAPPPSALDSNTSLPDISAYTIINGEVTSSTLQGISAGDTFSSGYVIDDSSPDGVVLYRVQDTATNVATDADPFTNIPTPALGPNLVININSVVNTNYSTTEIVYTIQNTGDTATSSGFQVMGWHDRATAPVYGVASSGNFNSHNIMAAGASESGVLTVYNTTVTPGDTLNAYLIADIFETIGESNEGLTGVNDNLSSMAWTAGDIFIYRGADFSDINTTTTITATYYASSDSTRLRFNDSVNGSYTFIIDLNGEIAAGTYNLTDFTSAGSVKDVSDISPTETYTLMPWEPVISQGAEIVINSAGAAGEIISGTYSANLCLSSASQTCSSTKVYQGSFSMIRDANAP